MICMYLCLRSELNALDRDIPDTLRLDIEYETLLLVWNVAPEAEGIGRFSVGKMFLIQSALCFGHINSYIPFHISPSQPAIFLGRGLPKRWMRRRRMSLTPQVRAPI